MNKKHHQSTTTTDGMPNPSISGKKCAQEPSQGYSSPGAAQMELQNKIVELTSLLSDANEKISSMQSRLDRAGAIITNTIAVAQQKDQESKELQDKLDKVNCRISAQNELLASQNEMLASQNKMLKSLDKTISATKEALTSNDRKLQNKSEQVLYHCKRVDELKQQLADSKFKLPQSCQTRINLQDIVGLIRKILENSCAKMSSTSSKSKYMFEHLQEMLLDGTLHGGQARECSYNVFRRYVCENVFSADKILRHMDLHGGVLNFEGIESLREVETGGQSYQSTLIPSTAELQKVAFIVEAVGKKMCPFRMIRCGKNNAEGFFF
ncbi:hypothetical protein ACA910_007638 [Epithemia clementina (nom. ined.)]